MAIINLSEIADLINSAEIAPAQRDATLIYGEAKTGKTRYAATVAKGNLYKRIYWFDLENGAAAIFRAIREGAITPEEAKKFIIIQVTDMPDKPYAYETIFNLFRSTKPVDICDAHGRISCPICKKASPDYARIVLDFQALGNDDCIVVDSGSQFAASMMSHLMRGKGPEEKPGWDEYNPQALMLHTVLSIVQAAHTNHIWIAHQLIAEDTKDVNKDDKLKKDRFYPLIGTKNFSSNVAKYFSNVIYLRKKLGKHAGMSCSTSDSEVVLGSRDGLLVENDIGLQNLADVILAARKLKASKS